jgi:hypothetical protein
MAKTPRKTPTKKTPRKAAPKPQPTKPAATGSVIKRSYQLEHQPDDLAVRLRKAVSGDEGAIDAAKLQEFAKANDCWRDRYATVNKGMSFMNVSNRLRALVRRGGKIQWGRQ